jgi:hypothetical protein
MNQGRIDLADWNYLFRYISSSGVVAPFEFQRESSHRRANIVDKSSVGTSFLVQNPYGEVRTLRRSRTIHNEGNGSGRHCDFEDLRVEIRFV